MLPEKRASPEQNPVAIVILAAGYGTRLKRDMDACPFFKPLSTIPKPLLPLAGRPILTHWLEKLASLPCISSIVIITNATHHALYETWRCNIPQTLLTALSTPITIVSDGTSTNATRLGAVADMSLALEHVAKSPAETALIIAGDTLLPNTDIVTDISKFHHDPAPVATYSYLLSDIKDCTRRGMLSIRCIEGLTYATSLVEKPPTPEEAPSNQACAPVYMLRRSIWPSLSSFLQSHADEPLERRDAPGLWLSHVLKSVHRCRIFKADSRVDIGGLCHYKDALHGLCDGQKVMRRADEPAVGRAYPRVGLLGNPSDGYGGKVIAVAIESEGYAEAIAVPSLRFEIVRNADMELSADFEDTAAFFDEVGSKGVRYGAHALVMAAAIIFARAIKERKSETGKKVEQLSNCKLIYSTCIPSCIGLSGSSALILAGLRALARFHGTTLEEVNTDIKTWPVWMRQAELEMGIACGLMDRVIQVMHGCVWMDFSGKGAGSWERLDEKKLPELWTVYKNENGTCSGVVHGSLKRRFEAGDEDMRETICKLSQVAEEGKTLFQTGEWTNLPELMRRNFELREQLVGDVGHANRHLIRVANEAGFSAKMCGSGGSAICIANTARQLDLAEVERARKMLEQHGMVLHRVKVLKRRTWGAGNITKPKKKELDKV